MRGIPGTITEYPRSFTPEEWAERKREARIRVLSEKPNGRDDYATVRFVYASGPSKRDDEHVHADEDLANEGGCPICQRESSIRTWTLEDEDQWGGE